MKKAHFSFFLAILFCVFFVHEADAQRYSKKKKQKNRFGAGIVAGVNVSQIDGDLFTGFNKVGFRGGLESAIYINKRLDIVLGLLYVQKGSKTDSNLNFTGDIPPNTEINLDYMEVPFLLSLKFGKEGRNGYALETGFSYARLVNSQINVTEFPDKVTYSDLIDNLNSNEFNIIFKFDVVFTEKFKFGILTEFQLNKLYEINSDDIRPSNQGGPPQIEFMRNYLIGLQVGYRFF